QVGVGIIHPPAQPAHPAPVRARAGIGLEDDTCEGEHVRLKARSVGPVGGAGGVGVGLARGADLVLVYDEPAFNPDVTAGKVGAGVEVRTGPELGEAETSR